LDIFNDKKKPMKARKGGNGSSGLHLKNPISAAKISVLLNAVAAKVGLETEIV